jgi:hypothetical protein
MCSEERSHRGPRRHQAQCGNLQQQRENQRDRAKRADARILHDFEGALARRAAAESVAGVGEPVLVNRTSHEHSHDSGENRRQRCGHPLRCEPQRGRAARADDQTDDRKIANRTCQLLLRMTDPRRHANAREVLHGREQQADLGHRASLSATPADSKLAISVMRRAAESINGHASAAPLPSPSRRRRSSKGCACRCSSSLRCPASAEQ